MDSEGTGNFQGAIDQMPSPPSDERDKMSRSGRVPPEDRYTEKTPNLSKGTTPTKNPVATTNYSIKSGHPSGAA
jgi:hypothetical protein